MNGFKNASVYLEGRGIVKSDLYFDSRIVSTDTENISANIIDLPEDAVVLPGFIDLHGHGAFGCDTMDGTVSAIEAIAKAAAMEGTTSFLPTTMTQGVESILSSLSSVKEYMSTSNNLGARVLGVHLEGPFIAAAFKGAQPLEYIEAPDKKLFDAYNEAAGGEIKVVTLAPEIEGTDELIKHLDKNGIVASIGHSAAKEADVLRAIEAGAKSVTHTFNAQSPFHHRDIGVAGSALLYDELNCEVIADLFHVSASALKLLVKSKPLDKITLVTDAMRAKWLSDGESELGGQRVYIKDGECRLADGTIAGSTLKMNHAIKNMVKSVGISLTHAVDLATANPARLLGIYHEYGSISVGKRADLAVLDSDFRVIMTIRDGEILYKSNEKRPV